MKEIFTTDTLDWLDGWTQATVFIYWGAETDLMMQFFIIIMNIEYKGTKLVGLKFQYLSHKDTWIYVFKTS